ncbi:uncharacterized protein LOC107693954 isoform X3 [Sinocyclocheilus anshuiensis]|uniref:uncharacterized protein LOC107693954 isoform X3 n=1 Tax=Sinocyclocheilus anshuiensis TaxID=1608454 RepID=UPI0007BAC9F4|nr:PREDICTED: uncharacterized protein LOC107693954 isoform X3 [Sinocyclocheilus anshuiensis]
MRASSLIKVTGSLSSHSHHAYLFIWSNSWLVTHHSCICDMNGLQRSMSSHVMLPAHECETPPNHPTLTRSGLQKSHIAGGLSTVKGAGLVPHTYTQTRVPVRSKGVWCGNGDRGDPCVVHGPGGRVVRDGPG